MSPKNFDSNAVISALEQSAPVGVTIVPKNGNEIPHPNCLVVEPFCDTARGDRLLATVEHYLEVENPTGFPWRIVPVSNDPMTLKDAMDLAMDYATRQAVPVIVVNHEGMSSDSERQQTDTAILDIRLPKTAG